MDTDTRKSIAEKKAFRSILAILVGAGMIFWAPGYLHVARGSTITLDENKAVFELDFTPVLGNVILCQVQVLHNPDSCPPATMGRPDPISDIVRFMNSTTRPGKFAAAFFSDFELEGVEQERPRPRADRTLPSSGITGKFILEAEAKNGEEATPYKPSEGDPGFAPNVDYTIISDSIPEPSTVVYFSTALASMALIAWRSKRRNSEKEDQKSPGGI
jgi:hypothetical protein